MGKLEIVCPGHGGLPEPDPVGVFLLFFGDTLWGTGTPVQRPIKVED